MKMFKRIALLMIVLLFFISTSILAYEPTEIIEPYEYTNEFKQWLELPDKEDTLMPRPFEVLKTNYVVENPIKLTQKLGNSSIPKFDLRNIIPENLVVKNQGNTLACWSFSSIASFESNLSLKNYYNNIPLKNYDFSEKHLLYATTRKLGNEINNYGVSKGVADGGNYLISSSYYSSQIGPVNEEDMPYDLNFEEKSAAEVFSKKSVARLYDYAFFPQYDGTQNNINEIKEEIKNHVKTYGGVEAGIYGAQIISEYYNNSTGALYCDDAENHPYNHEVLIIGWNDEYSRENFNETHRPKENGAWIVKNSWGTHLSEYTYDQMREEIFSNVDKEVLENNNIRTKADITDEIVERFFRELGYEVEDGVGYIKLGDNGFMYISYEDDNVYRLLGAVQDASDTINYDYIYQYDYAPAGGSELVLKTQESYIGNIFEKQSDGIELLNEVAITNNETVECKVFVNPNSRSMSPNDLQEVKLKDGETKTIQPGYHTIELLDPIKITGNEFAVVMYLKGNRSNALNILLEAPISTAETFKDIEVENGKCFWTTEEYFLRNEWQDCSKLYELTGGGLTNADTTIKAFTTKYDASNSDEPEKPEEPIDTVVIPFQTNGATVKILSSKSFYFTDINTKEYMTLKISVDNVERSLYNDSSTYYYYLSTNINENNIEDSNWVKISENQNAKNCIIFTVDTRDIGNYSELLKGDELYLYIKEVANKGDETLTTISNSLKIKNDVQSEIYKDNIKQENNAIQNDVKGQTESKDSYQTTNKNQNNVVIKNQLKNIDSTTSNKKLPNTGRPLIIIFITTVLTVLSIYLYKKYEDIEL